MIEEWRDVKGWEERYEVSNLGAVRSKSVIVRANKGFKKTKATERVTWQDKDGYHKVRLYEGKRISNYFIHRLVAMAFIENPNDLPVVNHKDGKKTNNKANNLEFVTPQRNLDHAKENGLFANDLTEIDIGLIEIFYHKRKMKQGEIARHFGIDSSNVSRILNNKTYRYIKRIFTLSAQ